MPLITIPKVATPRIAGWLVPGENCTKIGYDLVLRAYADIGILEVPNGSNRGTRIDAMAARLGFKFKPGEQGVYWCAIAAACWAADCGLRIPENAAGTDYWLPYVKPGKWDAIPKVGDFVVYGLKKPGPVVAWGDAHHIGLVVRTPEHNLHQDILMTIEGNRSFAGTTSNSGLAVDIGPMSRNDILGYVSPAILGAAA